MFKNLFKKKEKPAEKPAAAATAPPPAEAQSERVTKDDFESLDVLGKGSFAQVVLARHIATGKYYAMKVVQKQGLLDHKRVQDVFTERNILTRSNHPFLLKLHYTFQSEHKLFFVMDYMPGGDLDKYMNAQPNKLLDPVTAKLYAAQVFLSITYLHENRIIYRDLKPENILMTREGNCALADFGLSKDFGGEEHDMRCASFVGSPFYVAPDVLKQKEYTSAVDFWSFGILLFRMLAGRPPFSGRSMKEVFDNIMFSELRFPSSVVIAPDAKDLISKLLTKDANKRIKAAEIRSHPYWDGLNFDDVYHLRVSPPNWTPLPTVEEYLAQRAAAAQQAAMAPPVPAPAPAASGSSSSKAPPVHHTQVVNTPANTTALAPGQQDMFTGFSCVADNVLQSGGH